MQNTDWKAIPWNWHGCKGLDAKLLVYKMDKDTVVISRSSLRERLPMS